MSEELTMEMKHRRLNKLVNDLEEAKSEKDQKVGERKEKMSRLNQQFAMKTLEEARKRINNLEATQSNRNKAIEKAFNNLSEKYEI